MPDIDYNPKCGDVAFPSQPVCATHWAPRHACWLRDGHAGDHICACNDTHDG